MPLASCHIRPGLRWSDGTPIDAATYAFSLNRLLSPCTSSLSAFLLLGIQDAPAYISEYCAPGSTTIRGKIQTLVGDSLLVPDSQTLVIKMTAPAPYLLATLTTPAGDAQPEQLLVQSVAWIPLGQGLAFYDVRTSVAGFGLTGLGYLSLDQLYAIKLVTQ